MNEDPNTLEPVETAPAAAAVNHAVDGMAAGASPATRNDLTDCVEAWFQEHIEDTVASARAEVRALARAAADEMKALMGEGGLDGADFEQWFRKHFHVGDIARDTTLFNHVRAAADKLKARLFD